MSVEFEQAHQEAIAKLAATCVKNLTELQESRAEGQFSFRHRLGWLPQDKSTYLNIPILTALARAVAPYGRREMTFIDFTYKDGDLRQESYHIINNRRHTIHSSKEDVSPKQIPFSEFLEEELIQAAKTTETHLAQTRSQPTLLKQN